MKGLQMMIYYGMMKWFKIKKLPVITDSSSIVSGGY